MPQHLKDMIATINGEHSPLLYSLASFSILVLEGRVPPSVRPFIFGANLILRRLVAKIAGNVVREEMVSLLARRQLGYGVRGGAEAAVHATRLYLNNLQSDHAVLKLDFKNAFNCLRRDTMLKKQYKP